MDTLTESTIGLSKGASEMQHESKGNRLNSLS